MITDADIKKMKMIFVTKIEFKKEINVLNSKIDSGFIEIINFIGEIKNDMMKELNNFRSEFNEFRNEIRDINRGNQSTLNNHESRIVRLEYTNKIT